MPRHSGIPNKNKQALIVLLEAKYPGYQPVLSMAEIANDDENDLVMRFNAHKEIAQYIVPKLKAVEISGNLSAEILYVPIIKRFDGSEEPADA